MHNLFSELTGGAPCGPATCFELYHGAGETQSVPFRIRNDDLSIPLVEGDCIEVYAPLTLYDGLPRIDVTNFDWFRWYGNEADL